MCVYVYVVPKLSWIRLFVYLYGAKKINHELVEKRKVSGGGQREIVVTSLYDWSLNLHT